MKISRQIVRRLIVFVADTCIYYCVALFFGCLAMDALAVHFTGLSTLLLNIVILYVLIAAFQIILRTYDSLWRYAAHREYFALCASVFCGAMAYTVGLIMFVDTITPFHLELSLVWAIASSSALIMLAMRFTYRIFRDRVNMMSTKFDKRSPVAIVGAGKAGLALLNEFQVNQDSTYRPVCFFDDDAEKQRKRISGIPVKGKIEDIPNLLTGSNINNIFVAMPSLSDARISEVLTTCAKVTGANIQVLPGTLFTMAESQQLPLAPQLRKVDILDLLGRKQISLKDPVVSNFLSGRVVLVTGGGGSIGSELCRQIAAAKPKQLIIIDIYENNAYDIQQELTRLYGESLNLTVEIASIRDNARIDSLFNLYRPEVVFHAAAHKHVPLMEHNPQEAIRNNVFGTYNVVMAAHRFGVKRFVQISTDKAVNPTNVMGATKRMCEMIEQSMAEISNTEYVAVRFGNVLGSNGSVIPLFRRQIAEGGPITLTDRRIIRYFMTIPEAAQLVLQAGAMARKNQVFVLDMGSPVKIIDLAENLIRLSGLVPYQDIDIQEVGLRPGEKLFEELLISGNIEHTENDLIFIEKQPHISREALEAKLTLLRNALDTGDNDTIIAALHIAVPTFKRPEEVNAVFLDSDTSNHSTAQSVEALCQ